MKVSAERLEGSRVQLNVEIDPERAEKSLEKAYRRLASKTHVPGFRKGKIPRPILERFLGKDVLLNEALDELVTGAYNEAIAEHNIDALLRPEIEVIQLEPVTFRAVVAVRPEVQLGDYRSLRFAYEPAAVKEEDIEAALQQIQEQASTHEPVDRPVQFGDLVTADVFGTMDDQEIVNQKEARFVVAEGYKLPAPGFNEALVGAQKDEEKVIDLSFPADYEDASLAGHSFHFRVTIHEVSEKRLPPIDDELARTVGEGIDTLAELRERIAANLKTRAEREAMAKLREDVISAVSAAAQLEIPQSLVDHEVEHQVERRAEALKQQRMSLEQYLSVTKQSKDDLQRELRPGVVESLKREFVLDKIAEVEHIEVSPMEVDTSIERTVLSAGQQGEALRRVLSSPEGRASLETSIRREKTVERLLHIATEGTIGNPPKTDVVEGSPAADGDVAQEANSAAETPGGSSEETASASGKESLKGETIA